MAARAVAGVRASRRRPTRRDHQPVPTRPAARARRVAPPRTVSDERRRSGLLFGVGAYAMWGMFPAFFPLLKPAGAFEVLAHRIVWSFALMAVVIVAVRRLGDLRDDHRAHVAVADLRVGADLGELGDLHLRGQQRPRGGRGAGLLHQPAGHRGAWAADLPRTAQPRAVRGPGDRGDRGGGADRVARRAAGHRARAGAVVRPVRGGQEGGADRSAGQRRDRGCGGRAVRARLHRGVAGHRPRDVHQPRCRTTSS